MTQLITPLEPLTFPLSGSHLIEASAGTGKTFTITALYVRLVLGHGNACGEGKAFANARPLAPPEILVVTFTDAATRDLRSRIRTQLAEAAEYFRKNPDNTPNLPKGQDFLHDLRSDFSPDSWAGCAYKLQLASEWMDESAVSTIHGWCNRMLREHAFDSQSLFTRSMETDQAEPLAETIRDYWRNHYYPLSTQDIAQVTAYWSDPPALEKKILPLLKHVNLLPSAEAPEQILQQTRTSMAIALGTLKEPWKNWTDELEILFQNATVEKRINLKKFREQYYKPWLAKIRDWANSPEQKLLEIGKGWERLTPEGMAEIWIDGPPPIHPAFENIPRLQKALNNLPDAYEHLLAHATHWVSSRFSAIQKKRALMGFDDLLIDLDAALASETGERLARIIRTQFPVALIDEFQDTDPVQYRIFDRIYEIAKNRSDCALILIGDPKQAIYAFRGADVHTYLKARKSVQERLYSLGTNYRSTKDMVSASNRCFEFIESQETGNGAFLFRDGKHNPVPFHPVRAKGRDDRFLVDNQVIPALTAAIPSPADNMLFSIGAYLDTFSEICATRIVNWLNLALYGRAGFSGASGSFIPLRPGDIAILVNNGKEAMAIRQSLRKRGIHSVYLSDRDSVYQSPQATEIHRWLSACAEPDNDRLLRAALSTETLGLSFADIEELNQDENAWESRVIQFMNYRKIWQLQGVLPMLRRILLDFGCNERLLDNHTSPSGINGERILTDLLHLAELLQQASHTLEGEHTLVRFLEDQCDFPAGEAENRKVRLESDANLVQVITIHKSKGLEYPVVFLPFICATRIIKQDDSPLKWHDENGNLQISLKANTKLLEQAERNRLAEDVRKVYVAITRARHAVWMGLAPVVQLHSSAIGHLLGLDPSGSSELLAAVENLARDTPSIALEISPQASNIRFASVPTTGHTIVARIPVRSPKENWWISSYSGLHITRKTLTTYPQPGISDDSAQTENLMEKLSDPLLPDSPEILGTEPMHRFFKGAGPGTFLHEILEWMAGYGFAAILENPAALRETILRHCKMHKWESWVQSLEEWMKALLEAPLLPESTTRPGHHGSGNLRLRDLKNYRTEMEFWFETHNVDLNHLDRIVTTYTLGNRNRPALLPEKINGILKGFMDLVFEHEGKYFIADYKSNWLGARNDAYSVEAMDEAVRDHRYDLQYSLYLFALHRLLQSRLPDYDYNHHVGGVIYLFMRGISAPSAGIHFERPPAQLMIELDLLFRGVTDRGASL